MSTKTRDPRPWRCGKSYKKKTSRHLRHAEVTHAQELLKSIKSKLLH